MTISRNVWDINIMCTQYIPILVKVMMSPDNYLKLDYLIHTLSLSLFCGPVVAACLSLLSGHNAITNEGKNVFYLLAEKANDSFYSNRRQVIEMTTKGSLPMEAVDMDPEPSNPYSPPRQLSAKQNGHKYKSPKSHSSQSLSYNSNIAASPGALRSWESKDTLGLRQSHAPKKLCIVEKELHTTRYMPPQPYYVTNSKTEVTVWVVVCEA